YLLTCRSTQDGHLNKTHQVTIHLNDTKLRLIRSLKSLNRRLLLLLLGAKIILRLLGQMLLNFSLSRLICFRSEEHTSELQSRFDLVCRLLLEKKKMNNSESV